MQNLVVFIEPSDDASNISAKAASLYLNRFCIDEDSACELTGVYYLKSEEPLFVTLKHKMEGKGMASISDITAYLKLRTLHEIERARLPNDHQYDQKWSCPAHFRSNIFLIPFIS